MVVFYTDQSGFKLLILLTLPFECWAYRQGCVLVTNISSEGTDCTERSGNLLRAYGL